MSAFYRRSAIYAAFFEPSAEMRASVDRVARTHLRRMPRRVLDPACGPGLWLDHFRARGAEVAGCDLEESAVALAAERLPARGARVVVGDMRRPPDELGAEFDLVINLDNSIGHLSDFMDAAEHLRSIRQRLSPRGVYLLGLAIREPGDAIETGVVFERGPVDIAGGGFAALRTESLGLQPVTNCERIRQIAITANVPDAPPVIAEQYDLLTFPFAILRDVLALAGGFEVLACLDATDEDLPPARFRKGAGDVVLVLRPSKAPARRARGARAASPDAKAAKSSAAKSRGSKSKPAKSKPASRTAREGGSKPRGARAR